MSEQLREGEDTPREVAPIKGAIVERTPLEQDVWIYRIVVLTLGLTVLGALAGAIILSFEKITPVPDLLVALGSAAVGAMAGLLAPPPAPRS